MRARIALLAYVVAVLLGTCVHDLRLLALGLAMVLALARGQWLRIARRACAAVLAFNAAVTVSYAVIAGMQGSFSWHYVALVNLRVLFLTCLTFVFASRADLFKALDFSRNLTYLFTLACGQAMTLAQTLENFRLALKSRSVAPAALRDRYRGSASAGLLLLDKSLHNAAEITRAMRSRGFFDD